MHGFEGEEMPKEVLPDLADQVVLITGAGRGLGRSLALHLARCGAVVGVADIDGASAVETAAQITAAGGEAHSFACDVGGQDAFAAMAADFARHCGRIDAVVNNAAHLRYEPLESITEETVDRMLAAGFKSAIWGSQALVRHMRRDVGGAIVNLSSPVVVRGYPNTLVYSAVKSAVTSLTRTLAAELGPRKIRVNAVAPGSVPTPGALGLNDAAEYERRARTIPLRRLGRESDNDKAVAFLLSRDAEFINGAVLSVDGGIAASA
jgi:NAD(P)-dependent dehydrogenase (short-subunit alcohol dehydrogenase family)